MGHYRTVIFDLDGTLLDTLDDLTDSVNFALQMKGYPVRTQEEIRSFIGNGVRVLVARALPQGVDNPQYADCLACFTARYAEHKRDKTAPYEGILPLLHTLHDHGYQLGIVSNKIDAAVKELARDYFPDLIDIAIGDLVGLRNKPAPDCVQKALLELNADPKTAVYVGDSDVDVETAHNSGLLCIGAGWGFRGRDFLVRHGADAVIDAPMELLAWLNRDG